MKQFLIKLLYFIVPVILLSWPADIFLSHQLKKSKTYAHDEFSVWNDLYDGNIKASIAIYGSSRAWVHIDPMMIESKTGMTSYNLGIDGHNFWLQHLRHNLLFEKNSPPEIIIFSLDMFTLQKKHELYNADQFLPYMLYNTELKNYIDKYEGYSIYDYYIPLVRFYGKRQAVKNAFINTIVAIDPDTGRTNGYQGMYNEWNKDFDLAKKAFDYYEVKTDIATVALFKNFLIECKQKRTRVVFVYTPELIEGQKFVKNREQIMDMYTKIAKENDIVFLDYSEDEISYNINYFYNTSHLKISGAELFTSKLIDDLKKLNIISSESNGNSGTSKTP